MTSCKQYLEGQGFCADGPLFPATEVILDKNQQYMAAGLSRNHSSATAPDRDAFKEAFAKVGLPYHNPHSFRKTLVRLVEGQFEFRWRVIDTGCTSSAFVTIADEKSKHPIRR